MIQSDIDVENVTVFQWSVVRDTVADDLVRTCADRLREVAVVQR